MDKTIVLSKEKQLILATLYVAGIRGITLQGDDFALWHEGGFFDGNLKFVNDTFDFSELSRDGILEPHTTYNLANVIETFCPLYIEVLG